MPWEQVFWSETIDQIQASLTTWVPSILVALLLLIVGWILARIIQAIVSRLLHGLGLDRLSERAGIAQSLTGLNVQRSLASLLGRIAYWLILIFFILLALGALGLTEAVSATMNAFFAFLPRLIAATAILLAGAFLARVAGDATAAVAAQSNIPSGRALGQAVHYGLLLVVVIVALDQLGVQTTILTTIIIVTIATLGIGLALAFGLGNRKVAHSIMAGLQAREEFKPGQMLTVRQYTGRLLRIGATKTLLETEEGQISLPNIVLLHEVVTMQPPAEIPAGAAPAAEVETSEEASE